MLVDVLTIDQKVAQLHGEATEADFRVVPGIPELCIPDLTVTNGPAGIGASTLPLGGPKATAVPSPLSVASSWDPDISTKFGNLVADEMNHLGRNLLESPDVDVARTPLAGRTFEAFGEDPLLISRIANAQIEAVQAKGIIAMVKHYVGNSQEKDRLTVSADVDERTLRELYLAPFEAAVRDADVASVMCAYNKLNGVYSCENEELLTNILRDDWGFEGFVQSDFGATHSTVESAKAGMDLEMPMGAFFGEKMADALDAGEISEDVIDRMLLRRFTQMFRFGLFDRRPTPSPIPVEKHAEVARRIGEAGTVLLRNDGDLLPLSDTDLTSIAVVGPASATAATGGGGSSKVTPLRTIAPIDGIRERVGDGIEVLTDSSSDPVAASKVAASADVAVVVVGAAESEGSDRADLGLGSESNALIEAVAAANKNTVVVVHTGGPVVMPWIDKVSAVVMGWYPGQEDGTITASILFGDAEPGGRLPITFPKSEADLPTVKPEQYPGVDGSTDYSEGLQIGYRHNNANDIEPLFPFGFGLGYTTWSLDDLNVPRSAKPGDSVEARVKVKNTGQREGSTVIQAYLDYPDAVGEPPGQLRDFQKVTLKPGQSKVVTLTIDKRGFSFWDTEADDWKVAPGMYKVLVGTSSQDTPLESTVTLKDN